MAASSGDVTTARDREKLVMNNMVASFQVMTNQGKGKGKGTNYQYQRAVLAPAPFPWSKE